MILLVFFLAAAAHIRILTPVVKQHERIEVEVSPGAAASNSFDPSEAAGDATIVLPSGRTIKVPGFWFQAFPRSIQNPSASGVERIETLTPAGPPGWRVRFASP